MDGKKRKDIFKTIATLILLAVLGYIFLHKISVSNTGQGNSSTSKLEAKQDGFFITDYIPTKNECSLKRRGGKFTIDTAWVQYPWHWEPNNFVTTKERHEDDNYYCFCFHSDRVNMRFFAYSLAFFSDKVGGSFSWDIDGGIEGSLYSLPDTLRVLVLEKINLNRPDEVPTDTIIFVKRRL
jgi:hypothetical protein